MKAKHLVIAAAGGAALFAFALSAEKSDTLSAPETILLDDIEGAYDVVEFPHALHAEISECGDCHHHGKESSLTIACKDCHLQSSATAVETPSCGNCHVTSLPERSVDVASLKGAYHRQCLSCHYEPGSGMKGCTSACHAVTTGRSPSAGETSGQDE